MSSEKQIQLIGKLNADRTGIEFEHSKLMKRVLHSYENIRLLVTFEPLKIQRSLQQNRWLFGVAYTTIQAWYRETQGESISKEDLHEYVVQHVLGVGVTNKEILGVPTTLSGIKKRTSGLSIQEFQDFKEKLQAHFSEFGLQIPDPIGHNTLTDYIEDL